MPALSDYLSDPEIGVVKFFDCPMQGSGELSL